MKLPVPQSDSSALEALQRYCKRFSAMIDVPVLLLGANGDLVSSCGLNALHAQAHLQLPRQRVNLGGFQAFRRSNGLRDLHLAVPLDSQHEGSIVVGPFALQWDRDELTPPESTGFSFFDPDLFEKEWRDSIPELKDENLDLIGQFHRKVLEIMDDSSFVQLHLPHAPVHAPPAEPRPAFDVRNVSRLMKPYMEKMSESGLFGVAMFEILYDRKVKPVDFRLVGTSSGSHRITELDEPTYLGQLVSRIAHPSWFEHFFTILDHSDPYRFEEYSPLIGKKLRCAGERVDDTHIALSYTECGSSDERSVSSLQPPHQQLFEAWLLSTPDPFAFKSRELVYEIVNPAFCRLVDRDEAEILGKSDFDLFEEEDARRHQEMDLQAINRRTALHEEQQLTFDSEKRWFSAMRSPVFDRSGEPSGVLFALTAINSRRGTEQTMQESERKYRFIADNITDMIWMTDMTFSLTYVSPSVELICGYKPEQAIGLPLHERMSESSIEKAMEWIPEALISVNPEEKQDNSLRMELDFLHMDGHVINTETIVTLLRNEEGEGLGLLGVSRDISHRRESEKQREREDSRFREGQKLESLRHMAGGVAHDFNNLLTGIMGNISLALMDLDPQSPIYDFLKDVEYSAHQASDLAMQMLAYSGKGRLLKSSLDVNETINGMRHLINSTMNLGITLTYRLHEMETLIEADSVQFQQLVLNLVTNAVEAIGKRGGEIVIESGKRYCNREFLSNSSIDEELPEGTYAYIEVSDSGPGMDPNTMSRVFDPFFSTKFTGRGLGLATVIGIVRAHNGTVTVSSSLGKGSVFTVFFPIMDAEPVEPPSPPSRGTEETRTILIADDEPVVQRLMQRTLSRSGLKVLTASNGFEAIAAFQNHRDAIDTIVLDLTMPKMGGEQALDELRELGCDVPILLSSGYSDTVVSERFQGKKIAGFLQKPFSPQELLDRIDEVTRS